MKDKFCFSKTLTYLVLLVVVVVAGFYVINYSNTQKLGANPKAAGTVVACKVYNTKSDGSLFTGGSSTSRYIAAIEGRKCYGFSGKRTSYSKENYSKAGGKIYNNDAENKDYNGCFMKEIPCIIDSTEVSELDSGNCPTTTYRWAPKNLRTGSMRGEGELAYFAFDNVCTRNSGKKIKTWVALPGYHQYASKYRCVLTQAGVSEWNCNKGTAPTPVVIDGVNNSTGKAYTFDASADLCPANLYVWRSKFYNKDVGKFGFVWNGATKRDDDLCMKLTGIGRVVKNLDSGGTEVRCKAVIASNDMECNGTKKSDGTTYAD